ncbi:MAG: hypothetical protein EXS28_03725 [Pedosphaera sp.]|nr:hypothetical protein [Pedosphaera sp.]
MMGVIQSSPLAAIGLGDLIWIIIVGGAVLIDVFGKKKKDAAVDEDLEGNPNLPPPPPPPELVALLRQHMQGVQDPAPTPLLRSMSPVSVHVPQLQPVARQWAPSLTTSPVTPPVPRAVKEAKIREAKAREARKGRPVRVTAAAAAQSRSHAATVAVEKSGNAEKIAEMLHTPEGLRHAFLATVVLGAPKALAD